MPFRSASYRGSFTPADLALLQQAYNRSCEIMDGYPASPEDKERLARFVIRTFENGERGPEAIATKAAEMARIPGKVS